MSLAEKIILTAEEYLKGEETADFKHEYQNGAVWAMAGATDNHVTIAGNLFVLLKQPKKLTLPHLYLRYESPGRKSRCLFLP
jgi:Uma2 family endonuclease